jgi:hypothetical protein
MLMNPSQALIANRWLSVFLFIAIATLLSALDQLGRSNPPARKGVKTGVNLQ